MTTQTYRRARHSVSLLHAHLVFVTNYRHPVFTDAMLTYAENTMRRRVRRSRRRVGGVQRRNRPRAPAGRLPAHPGDLALVQRLKGRTAYAVRREYTGACVRARMRGHLWSPSYLAVSCGGAPLAIIKQYINGQARPL